MHFTSATTLVGALALGQVAFAAGLYHKSSKVMQVDGKDFDERIKFHDKPSVVEFYAPWCGHCKSLQPVYEKVAKALDGMVNVAAVNCDEEENKAFCGKMGIKGFPTLKTVRQTGIYGKPIMIDYTGGRSAPDIVEAGKNLIPNDVEKVDDKTFEAFLQDNHDLPRAVLFTEKGTTAALTKTLAHEYVTKLKFGQARKKEAKLNEKFNIDTYPTLVILPAGEDEPVVYDGKMEKVPMNAFFDKYAERYDAKAALKASKAASKSNKKASASDSSKFAKASAAHKDEDAADAAGSASTITIDMPDFTGQPEPGDGEDGPRIVMVPDPTPEIPTLATEEELLSACLGPKTGICVLAILPPGAAGESGDSAAEQPEPARKALHSLSELAKKHKARGGKLFPFYALPSENPASATLQSSLELRDGDVQLVALNGKRSWWNKFAAEKGFDEKTVENWIDSIRFGEAKKAPLPEGLVVEKAEEAAEKPVEHGEL